VAALVSMLTMFACASGERDTSKTGWVYDSGEYERALDLALGMAGCRTRTAGRDSA